MKLAITAAALAAAAALALPANAQARELRMPDFSHLRAKAAETVDVNVGGFLLGLARAFTSKEERAADPHLGILDDIKAVNVRSYKFDSDDAYTKADVDAAYARHCTRNPLRRGQVEGRDFTLIEDIHP